MRMRLSATLCALTALVSAAYAQPHHPGPVTHPTPAYSGAATGAQSGTAFSSKGSNGSTGSSLFSSRSGGNSPYDRAATQMQRPVTGGIGRSGATPGGAATHAGEGTSNAAANGNGRNASASYGGYAAPAGHTNGGIGTQGALVSRGRTPAVSGVATPSRLGNQHPAFTQNGFQGRSPAGGPARPTGNSLFGSGAASRNSKPPAQNSFAGQKHK